MRPTPKRAAPGARRVAAWAAMISVSAVVLAGCETGCCPPEIDVPDLPACLDQSGGGPVALAVGARANQPAPVLPEAVRTLMWMASNDSQRITVMNVDGDPRRLGTATFTSHVSNPDAWNDELGRFLADLLSTISGVRAEQPEANPLEALSRTADEVGEGGTVVLLDSGLQTLPPLNFLRTGLIDADPTETVDFLEQHEHLPDLTDRTVVLAGIGHTEQPQTSLDTARRDNLRDIWAELAIRAGARCVGMINESPGSEVLPDLPDVSPVPVPPPVEVSPGCTDAVLRDAGNVRFRPDEASFVDEGAALAALRDLADEIIASDVRVRLVGTTSSAGTPDGRLRLSEQRAEAVRDLLVRLGVPAGNIEATGVGEQFDDFEDDRDGAGNLIPEAAARNRSVIVQFQGCA